MFGNFGFGEMMVLLVIVLVLFGAKRIPEISASFGKGIREFKRNVNDVEGAILAPHDSTPWNAAPRQSVADPVRSSSAADDVTREPKRLL